MTTFFGFSCGCLFEYSDLHKFICTVSRALFSISWRFSYYSRFKDPTEKGDDTLLSCFFSTSFALIPIY